MASSKKVLFTTRSGAYKQEGVVPGADNSYTHALQAAFNSLPPILGNVPPAPTNLVAEYDDAQPLRLDPYSHSTGVERSQEPR